MFGADNDWRHESPAGCPFNACDGPLINRTQRRPSSTFVGVRPATDGGIDRVDRGNLLRRQREIKNIEVLCDALWLHGFGNGRESMLEVPAKNNLSGGLTEPVG